MQRLCSIYVEDGVLRALMNALIHICELRKKKEKRRKKKHKRDHRGPLTMRGLILRPLLVASGLGLLIGGSLGDKDPADRDAKTLVASDIFEMIPAGKAGSCSGKNVNQPLRDAATMADKGVDVLEKFVHNVMANDKEKQGIRYANMVYSMFGAAYTIDEDEESSDDSSDDDGSSDDEPSGGEIKFYKGGNRLQEALENFQAVQFKLKNTEPQGKLMCGDGDLKLVRTLGDLGLEPKNELISKKKKDHNIKAYLLSLHFSKEGPKGVYELDKALLLELTSEDYDYLKDGVCKKHLGIMIRKYDLMVLCDQAFELPTLQSTIDKQDSLARQPMQDSKGIWLIDKQRTTGFIVLHEAFHWIKDSIKDITIDRTPIYYFGSCFQLSQVDLNSQGDCDMSLTLGIADIYAIFGQGVTLKKVNWYPKGYFDNIESGKVYR